jgi:OOP family OmpA-OmpF porin
MKKFAIGLAAVAALVSTGARAQSTYVGASIGQGHLNVDCTGTDSCSNGGSSAKAYFGYGLGNGWATEVGYQTFGEVKATDGALRAKVKATAVVLNVANRLPFADTWGFTTRLGIASVKTEISGSIAGVGSASDSETKAALYAGFGVDVAVAKNVKLELTADFSRAQFSGEKAGIRSVNAGVRFDF